MNVCELDTPALILQEEIMLENIGTMDNLLKETGIKLRPHYKSHRCPYIAKLQMRHGAKGITCAKLGEAEDLADAGIRDILIANQITQPGKIRRLTKLAKQADMTVCVDSAQNIMDIEAAANETDVPISIFVEFEIGMHRCGVVTFDEVLVLARLTENQPHLRFRGIQSYAGNIAHERDFNKRRNATETLEKTLSELKAYLEANGINVQEISGISTGTVTLRRDIPSVYTEAQAGSYLFMDDAYDQLDLPFKNSLFILASVISVKKDSFHTDAGLKTCSIDQGTPVLFTHPEIESRMSEEHISHVFANHGYRVNDIVTYIPGHCCTNINLFDRIYLVRGETVIAELPVISRGKSQ